MVLMARPNIPPDPLSSGTRASSTLAMHPVPAESSTPDANVLCTSVPQQSAACSANRLHLVHRSEYRECCGHVALASASSPIDLSATCCRFAAAWS